MSASKSFDELWRFVCQRSAAFPVVQEYRELEYIFNLIEGAESYLEVGTAEGNSLYILSHALKDDAPITYIDWNEKHTEGPRNAILRLITNKVITPLHGDTHNPLIIAEASQHNYDVVLIDAGHSYDDVMQDARNYGKLATKYLLFHDVNLPEVHRAFTDYQQEAGLKAYKISNSETFGFGIMEIK